MKDFCRFCQISFVYAVYSEFFFVKVKRFSEFDFTAKFSSFEFKMRFRIAGAFKKASRHFFCKKNGERRRKSSLHCAKHNFTQKVQPFLHIFTKPRRRLTCEVISFRYRSIPLVKRSACAAREVAACRRVDVFLFTALLDQRSAMLTLISLRSCRIPLSPPFFCSFPSGGQKITVKIIKLKIASKLALEFFLFYIAAFCMAQKA